MDLWSGVFIALVSGFLVYLGLGVIWTIRCFVESQVMSELTAERMPGLGLATLTMLLGSAILLVLHITGVITMWEVGNALAKL